MNNHLTKAGAKLLNAMAKHSDLVMQAYLSGTINEADYSANVINNLVDLKVLWRPESDVQLRLRPSLRTLLEESLQDENNRQLDANIGNLLKTLQSKAEHYKEAISNQQLHESKAHLADLSQHVYTLTEILATNVRLLWSRINNEFGYVSSVDAKIRENELAQAQVTDMLDQLTLFKFDQLSELAGNHRELRHLLVVTLQNSFATCTQELSLVQSKLIELLGRFREFKGKTRLLKGFVLHMEQYPDYKPAQYASGASVPTLFNRAESLIKPAAVDVNKVEHEFENMQLLHQLHLIKRNKPVAAKTSQQHTVSASQEGPLALEQSQLLKDVEQFICSVIDAEGQLSALDYYQQQQLEYDPEVWLYQVIGAYQGLPESERALFKLTQQGQHHQVYSGNFLISDIHLQLQ